MAPGLMPGSCGKPGVEKEKVLMVVSIRPTPPVPVDQPDVGPKSLNQPTSSGV